MANPNSPSHHPFISSLIDSSTYLPIYPPIYTLISSSIYRFATFHLLLSLNELKDELHAWKIHGRPHLWLLFSPQLLDAASFLLSCQCNLFNPSPSRVSVGACRCRHCCHRDKRTYKKCAKKGWVSVNEYIKKTNWFQVDIFSCVTSCSITALSLSCYRFVSSALNTAQNFLGQLTMAI